MNKITAVIIEGKEYTVSHLSNVSLSDLVFDVNVGGDLDVVLHKYKIMEVK